jgi:hypothetical protein
MGWGLHAIVDVALGFGLIVAGIHGGGSGYLLLDGAGGFLLVLTLLTKSTGGVVKVVPRLVHRILDGLLAIALIVSPVALALADRSVGVFPTAMAVAVGVIVLRDALLSDHSAPSRPLRFAGAAGGSRSGSMSGSQPIDVTARPGRASAGDAARVAGVLAGRAKRYVRPGERYVRPAKSESSRGPTA